MKHEQEHTLDSCAGNLAVFHILADTEEDDAHGNAEETSEACTNTADIADDVEQIRNGHHAADDDFLR